MFTIGIILLVAYLALMIGISVRDYKGANNFTEYAVAGKKQSTRAVVLTLLATIFGASATIGIVDTTNSIGFPAIWWLWFGALGLLLQSLLISKKVRALNANTLPHAAKIIVGPAAQRLIALVIVISWIGVIAGQFIALGSIVSYMLGFESKEVLIIVCILAIAYTALGGQTSVVRTDKIQFYIVVLGLVVACAFLYFFAGSAGSANSNSLEPFQHIELLNDKYTPVTLVTQLFVVGGVFFLGPDILSRNLISKDENTAKKAAGISALVVALLAIVVVLIGMWAKYNVDASNVGSTKVLIYLMNDVLPLPVGIVLALALLSAILSSTDTCLINASSIFVNDLLGAKASKNVLWVRITVVVLGAISAIFAFSGTGDIITILSNAYSVYTPGVIFPLTVAILCYPKRRIRTGVWLCGVALGGICGLVGAYAPTYAPALVSALPQAFVSNLTLIGMGLSLVCALASVKWGETDEHHGEATEVVKTSEAKRNEPDS